MTRFLIRLPFLLVLWAYALGLVGYLLLRVTVGNVWLLSFVNNFAPYYFLPLLVVVPVAFAFRMKRYRWVSAALALVGLMWYAPRFVPTPTPIASSPQQTLKVVAFNVYGNNLHIDEVTTWLQRTDADVVMLQETPHEFATEQVAAIVDMYPYRNRAPKWGNAVYSRYPIVANEGVDLEGDGLLYHERIVIDVQGQLVALYNVHFFIPLGGTPRVRLPIDSPYANMLLSYDPRGRNGQIERLIVQLQQEEHPYIVGGDFNMSDNDVMYGRLAAHMHDSFRQTEVGLGATWPVAERARLPAFIPPMIRIDYIWHSAAFTTQDVTHERVRGSDHMAVVATLGME